MKVPPITADHIMGVVSTDPIESAYRLIREQPLLVSVGKKVIESRKLDRDSFAYGMALTYSAVEQAIKTPPDEPETSQDRLNRILRICNQVNDPGEDRDAFGAIQEIGDIASQQ